MNWDFEDFLQKAEGSDISSDEATIIPIQAKNLLFRNGFGWLQVQ
ncbi:hypothetical protein [Chryseobacterium indoltheticum]